MPETSPPIWSIRAKLLRLDEEQSVEAWARRCGLPPGDILRIEQGEHVPPKKALHAVAQAAGVSLEWLLGQSVFPT